MPDQKYVDYRLTEKEFYPSNKFYNGGVDLGEQKRYPNSLASQENKQVDIIDRVMVRHTNQFIVLFRTF